MARSASLSARLAGAKPTLQQKNRRVERQRVGRAPRQVGVASECSTACSSPAPSPASSPEPFRRVSRDDSPPCAPVRPHPPPLLQALSSRRVAAVRVVLAADPNAARIPFWEHSAEPPLCAAVRLCCCEEIVALLLSAGADANVEDVHGRTPMKILHEGDLSMLQRALVPNFQSGPIECALLTAGAVAGVSDFVDLGTVRSEGSYGHWLMPPTIDFDVDYPFC